MAQKGTRDMNDYLDDYENAWQDYQQMGPLWAEMVFGDDFEAMQALYGGQGGKDDYKHNRSSNDQDNRGGKRR